MTREERQARAQRLGLAEKLPSELERAFDTHVLQLAPQIAGLYTTEVVFHTQRKWRFDKAFQRYKVAVELHGGEWMQTSGHTSGAGFNRDREKINAAIEAGWLVLEWTGTMLRDNPAGCVEQLIKVLRMRGADV